MMLRIIFGLVALAQAVVSNFEACLNCFYEKRNDGSFFCTSTQPGVNPPVPGCLSALDTGLL